MSFQCPSGLLPPSTLSYPISPFCQAGSEEQEDRDNVRYNGFMRWIRQYWIAIVVGIVAIGGVVTLAFASSSGYIGSRLSDLKSKLPEELDSTADSIDEENTEPAASSGGAAPAGSGSGASLPLNVVPWGTGSSDQTSPSTGGTTPPPAGEAPWGQGPSQQ